MPFQVAPKKEYLLVFSRLGLYVDSAGRRTRALELMWPSLPSLGFAYLAPNLCVYSDSHVDVFNVQSAEWVQTLNVRRARPLTMDGALSLCYVNDTPYTVVLSDLVSGEGLGLVISFMNYLVFSLALYLMYVFFYFRMSN